MKTLPRTLDDILRLPRVTFLDRGLLPTVSGIYFVLFEANPVRLAYVGKADDFRARWTGHHREPDLELLVTLGIAVEIAWAAMATEEVDQAETRLISVFRPPLNARPTHARRQHRIKIDQPTQLSTAGQIIQDLRDRRQQALEALVSDQFWDACNHDDGDLICLWPYPHGVAYADVNELWSYGDSHPLSAFRVPAPPAFRANASWAVVPAEGFHATSVERREWLFRVALQVDAWLAAVASYHATRVSPDVRREVLLALAKEPPLTVLLAQAE